LTHEQPLPIYDILLIWTLNDLCLIMSIHNAQISCDLLWFFFVFVVTATAAAVTPAAAYRLRQPVVLNL
jgi:hypothetical protein